MFKILKNEKLADKIFLLKILAPDIAKHCKAGQFIIICFGERIPLTIADYDDTTISIIFLVVGKTTLKLSKLKTGIKDVVGPLGNKNNIQNNKFVCLIGGGVGIAAIYPIAKEYVKNGNKIHCILGVKKKSLLFWENKFKKLTNKVFVYSDDGSIGKKGNVVDALKYCYETDKFKYDLVIAVGPTIMMKYVAKYTYNKIKTLVSLNTIMVDGIGMCGGCRIRQKGKMRFVCVDGTEFDAKDIDFDDIIKRNSTYD